MEMVMDVDVALSGVPVNILALVDDTDFKAIEASVVYNQAGMDLVFNFITTAGVYTQTSVTPTTSGVYDWSNKGKGMYGIEIPASAGGSINNDAEGFGWFTGVATGILPWRGPIICFRDPALNNLLIDDALNVKRGLAGTALPDAVADAAGGLVVSDAGGLDIDSKLANTNEITTVRMQELDAANIPADIDTLLVRLSAVRGGYLDNLSAGAVALEASITAIKGAGWTTETLKALSDAIALISTVVPDASGTAAALHAITDGKVDVVDGVVDDILVDTAEIGPAGAGLTNINLPDQTMNITGNLSGSVGSVIGGALEATLTAMKGAGWTTETLKAIKDAVAAISTVIPDPAGTAATLHGVTDAKIDTLLSRLTAARAGYLDELEASNIPADIDVLLSRITGVTALEATLTAMKGVGWTNESLKLIKDAVDAISTVVPDTAGTAAALHVITDGKIDAVAAQLVIIFADTDYLQKVTDGEWELVSPNKLYFYEKGTRTAPGVGTILSEFNCYDSADQPTVTAISRVESI